jgi:hypothetical protein
MINDSDSKEYEITPELFHDRFNDSKSERELSGFLKKYPWPLYWSLCTTGGHSKYMFHEFPLSSRYRCDFVILNCYSLKWEIKFIEIEPINTNIFTKNRSLAKRTNGALTQVLDWKKYFSVNRQEIINELCRWIKNKKDILKYDKPWDNPSNDSGNYLKDPETFIDDRYYIIIGNSKTQTPEMNSFRGQYSRSTDIDIISYNRLEKVVDFRYPLSKHFSK